MLMMRARVQGHRWVDHPAAAVMEARVPGQWVDRPAAMVMEAREQGRCWIDHPAAAVMEARVQGRHWVDRPLDAKFHYMFIHIILEPRGSEEYEAVCKVVEDRFLLKDVRKLSPLYQTSALEAFHSLIVRFCPKHTAFSWLGMYCRP
ncbi:hypothetical protein ACOMHN_030996 [Nucella lapillus]